MEELVWNKIAQFLKELRCEDISRESYCETREYKEAMLERTEKQREYQDVLNKLETREQEKIEAYIGAIQNYNDEEHQQVYMQGFIDCIMMLVGAGIIKPRKEIKDIINTLK